LVTPIPVPALLAVGVRAARVLAEGDLFAARRLATAGCFAARRFVALGFDRALVGRDLRFAALERALFVPRFFLLAMESSAGRRDAVS
jgi:hypothetical protein